MDIETNNIPWVQKYRPNQIAQLISHHHILKTRPLLQPVLKFIRQNKIPNLLFYGPPGTGKTSTIKAIAKEIYNNKQTQILQLNASDARGINTVRDHIKDFVSTKGLSFDKSKIDFKLVILDQADSMTNASQFALRRKFWKNARFCIICNYVSRIIPALQSRCTKFKFGYIPERDAKERVKYICRQQGLILQQGALEAVFCLCNGDMRRVVNMCQSLSLYSKNKQDKVLKQQDIYKFTGTPSPQDITQIYESLVMVTNLQETYGQIESVLDNNGISLKTIVSEIYRKVKKSGMKESKKMRVIRRLGSIQYRLSINCDEKIQLSALICIFLENSN